MTETFEIPTSAASRGRTAEALLRLGKAVHKTTIYPMGHPAIPHAIDHFIDGLRAAAEDGPGISLGVARDRLLIDGEPIEASNATLSWLAERLFEAGIVAVEIARNLAQPEGVRFVHWVAHPSEADYDPDSVPSFEGITLTRYDFERVRFGEDPSTDPQKGNSPMRIWLTLMSGLFGGRDNDAGGRLMDDPVALAKEFSSKIAIGDGAGRAAMASRVVAMGSQLSELAEPIREAVKKRMGMFIEGLTPDLRSEILRVDPRSSRQKLEFVTEIVDALPAPVVIEVLGDLDRTGARIPHQFITLMNKLVHLSVGDPTLRAGLGSKLERLGVPSNVIESRPEEVRQVLSEVLQSRLEKNWNPEGYQALLEDLSERRVVGAPSFRFGRYADPSAAEEVRAHMAEIALQLLVTEPAVPEAPGFVKCLDEDAPRALETGRFEQVHEAAASIRTLMDQQEELQAGLAELFSSYLANFTKEQRIDQVLAAALESPGPIPACLIGLFRVAGREAGAAAFRKLEALEEGPESERLRELLAALDPVEFNATVARLRSDGWSALRSLFPVLLTIGGSRAVEVATTFVGTEDPKIRAEALRVLLCADDRPGQAERYIERGLFDESAAVAGFTLSQIRQRRSPMVTALVGALVREERGPRDDELRLRAIATLGAFATPDARDILIACLAAQKIAFFVQQVRIAQALEEALTRIGDEKSRAAVKRWRRSPARWISTLLVQGKVGR